MPNKLISSYSTIILLLTPILQPYNFVGVDMGVCFLFFNAVLLWAIFLVKKKYFVQYKSVKALIPFFIYAFTLPVSVGLLLYGSNGIGSSYRGLMVYALSFPIIAKSIDFEFLRKSYTVIVFALSTIFILQELLYYTTGIRFSALIPFFELNYDMEMEDFIADQMIKTRSSSMFLEPAHFAQYIAPCLAVNLGHLIEKRKLMNLTVIFLTLILFFLQSGSGIIMGCILYLLYLKKQKVKYSYLIVLFLVILVLIIDANINEGIIAAMFERRNELTANKSQIGSGMIRVFRGYYVYSDFPLLGKVFGVGNGAVGDVVMGSSARWMFSGETYLNNFQKLIIGYGFIGTALFIKYLKSLYVKGAFSGNAILTCFIAVSFMENMFFDSKMLFYMCIAVCANHYSNMIKQ